MARPRKNPKTVINTCEECKQEFEIGYYKRIQRFCSKKCSNGSKLTKQRIIESQKVTFDKLYDGKHPMQTDKTKENFKQSMMKTHGVEHALKNEKFIDKAKHTKKVRYGDENYNNTKQIKSTCIERYGVDNIRKSDQYNITYEKTCIDRYGVNHASKSIEYKHSHKLTMFKKFLTNERFKNFTPEFNIDEYQGVTTQFNQKYNFRCNRCDSLELHDISDGKSVRCSKCDKKFSTFQTEIYEFIKSIIPDIPITSNDRTILFPFELDIVIPELGIAFECDSLCFHSEVFGSKGKSYHLTKTKNSIAKGIRLIHILDNEWKQKQDIVKSIIRSTIKPATAIHGRKCQVRVISPKQSNNFLKQNHIQGSDRSSIKLGLFHDDELVSVMTFCKPRFNNHVEYELSRYCTLLNHTVHGGASKLFKHFVSTYSPSSIISYSDRRYFNGIVYGKLGFEFVDNTPPSYHYIVDSYSNTQNRVSWQKHKLKDKLDGFDPELSEWENMKNHGFDRIWDCGNSKWIWYSK